MTDQPPACRPEYWRMDLASACRQRNEIGIAKYRAGNARHPFRGDALVEMHEELLDALNYLAEARRDERIPRDKAALHQQKLVDVATDISLLLMLEEMERCR